jgi:hypothetical protein
MFLFLCFHYFNRLVKRMLPYSELRGRAYSVFEGLKDAASEGVVPMRVALSIALRIYQGSLDDARQGLELLNWQGLVTQRRDSYRLATV